MIFLWNYIVLLPNSTNQIQNQNQAQLGCTRFPALGTGYVYLLRVFIGSFCCVRLLWLATVIAFIGFGFGLPFWFYNTHLKISSVNICLISKSRIHSVCAKWSGRGIAMFSAVPPHLSRSRQSCCIKYAGVLLCSEGTKRKTFYFPHRKTYREARPSVATRQSFWFIFYIFLKTFWWLPFKLANQITRTVGGGDVNYCQNTNMELDNFASRRLAFWLASWNESHQKALKKMSKISQKLIRLCWVARLAMLGRSSL